jgi:hypothetical protein
MRDGCEKAVLDHQKLAAKPKTPLHALLALDGHGPRYGMSTC